MGRKQNRYENYGNFTDGLKTNYPGIIVDVISAINRGSRVNPISIEKYYQSRKQQAAMAEEKCLEKTSMTTTTTTAAAIYRAKIPLSKGELVERLVHITNRDRRS